MTQLAIFPYKQGSRSARTLATALSCIVLNPKREKISNRKKRTIINWGASEVHEGLQFAPTLNPPEAVATAVDKIACFRRLREAEVSIPNFTESLADAPTLFSESEKHPSYVVCRLFTRASGGRGLFIASTVDELQPAKLFVEYIKKREEYRVHVLGGEVIDVQRKMRSSTVPDDKIDWKIRNLRNGFIFGREDVTPNPKVLEESVKAVAALGLDFGAVDVVWNEHRETAYVLEINCAPGLEGTTVEAYASGFYQLTEGT